MKSENLTEYVAELYSAALRKSGDSYTAEEIAQETFLAVLKALRRGTRPDNMRAWLHSIMCNKYADLLRDKYNKPQVSFEDYPYEPADETDYLSDVEYSDKMEAIRRELGYLAKIHREVMVRFYMRGETLEKIASALNIPVGTVKSRLNAGRRQIREGVKRMENYAKQSYEPDTLLISCSGGVGPGGEPFTLVDSSDMLTQNVLLLAYDKPVTETELAKSLGVPVAYIEPVVEKMVAGELMRRTDGGMVYTDFIIYTEKDRKATFAKQLKMVDDFFTMFQDEMSKALSELREKVYYKRQSDHAKAKLELHFCIALLMGACIDVRNEVTGLMPYEDYPYRIRGGRWIAMGNKYPPGYHKFNDDASYWKYSISGEAGTSINNFRDSRCLELRKYDTELGRFPDDCFKADFIKWLYELLNGVPHEDSAAGDLVLESAANLVESGILKKEGAVMLDIPVLSHSEYHDEKRLSLAHQKPLYDSIRGEMIKMFEDGYVRLPHHLKSVPKWQQYILCGDRVPMAVIYKAIGQGLLLQNVDYPTPASILVVEKTQL